MHFTIVLSLRNLQAEIVQIYWMETCWSTHKSLLFNFKETILVLIVYDISNFKKFELELGFLCIGEAV